MKASWALPFVGVLFAAHHYLLHAMREEQVVAKLFAAGGNVDDVVLAIAFVALRLTLYVAGPGLVAYGLLSWRRSSAVIAASSATVSR